jgi:hypothetical protein
MARQYVGLTRQAGVQFAGHCDVFTVTSSAADTDATGDHKRTSHND